MSSVSISIGKFTDAERALLTDEELEGMMEDESEGDAGDADADSDGDGAGDEADTDVGDGTQRADEGAAELDAAAAVADPAASAADAPADGGAAVVDAPVVDTPAAADEADDIPQRAPAWSIPVEVGERIKAIDVERDQLAVDFDEGSLTAGELREKLRLLEDERDGLRTRQISAEVAKNTATAKWLDESVPAFLKDNPQYRNSKVLNQALDAEVRKLQAEAINPFDPKILQKAHATISGEITSAFKTPTEKQPAPANPNPKPATKTQRQAVPTLAHVPAADITDADDGGEFAYLDRLADTDSVAYEKELARLSPEKQDRYLSQ